MKQLVAIGFATILCLQLGTADSQIYRSTEYTNAGLSIRLDLPGTRWAYEAAQDDVLGWRRDGPESFYILKGKVRSSIAMRKELRRIWFDVKDRFSLVTSLAQAQCAEHARFDEVCFQKACGFSEEDSWTMQSEMIVFVARLGSVVWSGYFFSATPIYAEHNVNQMFMGLSPLSGDW